MKFPCKTCLVSPVCTEKCEPLEDYSKQLTSVFSDNSMLIRSLISAIIQTSIYLFLYFNYGIFYPIIIYIALQYITCIRPLVNIFKHEHEEDDPTFIEYIALIITYVIVSPFSLILTLEENMIYKYYKMKEKKVRRVDKTFSLPLNL